MKKIIVLTVLCIASIAYGQKDLSAPFIAYWSSGDFFELEIIETDRVWKSDDLTKSDSINYNATMTVLEETDTSYTLSWKQEIPMVKEFKTICNECDWIDQFKKQEVLFRTTETGEFLEITNWEELSKQQVELNRIFLEKFKETKGNKSQMKKLEDFLDNHSKELSSKHAIENFTYDIIYRTLYPMGYEYTSGETLEYTDTLYGLIGSAPIRSYSKVAVEFIDTNDLYCILNQTSVLDKDDVSSFIADILTKLPLGDNEREKEFENSVYDIKDNINIEYYYDPGIPVNLSFKRVSIISIGDNKSRREQETQIYLIEADMSH